MEVRHSIGIPKTLYYHSVRVRVSNLSCEAIANLLNNTYSGICSYTVFNISRPRQNRRHYADDNFKCIILNKNVRISIKEFIFKGPINNISQLVWIMVWRRPWDKPLFQPKMVSTLIHICVTWSE